LPAALGLVALSFGDGIGGAVGRRFGRHRYQVPGAKPKSLEGSLGVLLAACVGSVLVAQLFGHPLSAPVVLGLGLCAAVTEALAPRGSDNLLIPAAVWTTALLLT
jgi:phytol kinase